MVNKITAVFHHEKCVRSEMRSIKSLPSLCCWCLNLPLQKVIMHSSIYLLNNSLFNETLVVCMCWSNSTLLFLNIYSFCFSSFFLQPMLHIQYFLFKIFFIEMLSFIFLLLPSHTSPFEVSWVTTYILPELFLSWASSTMHKSFPIFFPLPFNSKCMLSWQYKMIHFNRAHFIKCLLDHSCFIGNQMFMS